MSRQQTPDIMGSLMGLENESNKTITQEKVNEIEQEKKVSIKEEQESKKAIKLANNKEIKQDKRMIIKEKATFNLSCDALETLENAWLLLRRKFKGEQRITKTSIVETALNICLKDLAEMKDDSELIKRLSESSNDDQTS